MSATKTYFGAVGRRKTASARVRITEGTGKIEVNGMPHDEFFSTEAFAKTAVNPLIVVELRDKIDVVAKAIGGGVNGQAGAVSLGIARCLQKMNPELRPALKKAGLLTRDPREKERKKVGRPGARKRFQFSKR